MSEDGVGPARLHSSGLQGPGPGLEKETTDSSVSDYLWYLFTMLQSRGVSSDTRLAKVCPKLKQTGGPPTLIDFLLARYIVVSGPFQLCVSGV